MGNIIVVFVKPCSNKSFMNKKLCTCFFNRLQKIYFRHAMKFLRQTLRAENLDPQWANVVVPIAKRVCDTVNIQSEVNMDICHFVHVKKVRLSRICTY